ncbi:lysylphosphatidylglycerol synthase domain-containing protein [Sediminibacterium soli]|uniref:lysylphosphatidylglycerol synthase domain-containing protein n=1 Tax=Sediminibacterium soli TaxID=2698829 RepID=UPI00137A4C3D|nr:lysylphosphatidylglycerol synthase domain-containing protein [Sediminibacterium soli]NCI45496.1 hypothetical protein [Sediminibacterium soli]
MLLSKRFKIFLNYVLGPAIFIWLSWSIYHQIQKQANVHQSWYIIKSALTGPQSWKLGLVIALMIVQWGFEARKWQILIGHIQKVSSKAAFRAILSGQALGFSTPNRVGELLGRAVFLDEGNRLRGIVLSLVGGLSQTIVTLLGGLLALVWLRTDILPATNRVAGVSIVWYAGFVIATAIGVLAFVLLFFRIAWVIRMLERIRFVNRYRFLIEELENLRRKELTRILLLSLCRYAVFIVQYILLLQVFAVEVTLVNAVCMVSVMLLILTIVPTIALAELGFRGQVSLQLFGLLSSNTIGIIATTAGIWIINLIIPAAAGSLFLIGIRIFRNKKEKAT